MSTSYRGVHWNRQKIIYDALLLILLLLGLITYVGVSIILYPGMTAETLALRGTAFLSLFLLHFVLAIGPLARLFSACMPLLYNRRHLGVTLFCVALTHGLLALIQFHGFGDTFPLLSVFTSYAGDFGALFRNPSGWGVIPFEPFGFVALIIFYFLAISSHDFWLRLFGASTWKTMHTLLYVAYGMVLVHVAFGFLQSERHYLYPATLLAAGLVLFGLHIAAHQKGKSERSATLAQDEGEGFVRACTTDMLHPGRGTVVRIGKKKIAFFLHEGRVYAVGNTCRHQGGPIGEGRILNGCITCPWHGWEYRPEDGESPPPFNEHVPTYAVKVVGGDVLVRPVPCDRGHSHAGAVAHRDSSTVPENDDFYVGYRKSLPAPLWNDLQGIISTILIACPIFMAAMAFGQAKPDRGSFEFGHLRTVEGVFYSSPVPSIYVVTPRPAEGAPPGYHFLLASEAKFGIPSAWDTFDGKRVSLTGSATYRREVLMFQIDRNSPPTLLGEPAPEELRPEAEEIESVRVQGELVDTKCYLGTMRPATGKVHRACAIRCLSGGVPPGILVRSRVGSTVVLLASNGVKPLEYDISWAGQVVEAYGTIKRRNGFTVILADRISLYEPDAEVDAQESAVARK